MKYQGSLTLLGLHPTPLTAPSADEFDSGLFKRTPDGVYDAAIKIDNERLDRAAARPRSHCTICASL